LFRITVDGIVDKLGQLLANLITSVLRQGLSFQKAETTQQFMHLDLLKTRQVASHAVRHKRNDVAGNVSLIIVQIAEDLCCGIERETVEYILPVCLIPPRCMRTLLG
jgi:hypothetical protein